MRLRSGMNIQQACTTSVASIHKHKIQGVVGSAIRHSPPRCQKVRHHISLATSAPAGAVVGDDSIKIAQ
jgi:hypothetical protein